MISRRRFAFLLLPLLLSVPGSAQTLRVMSFNVRLPSSGDGPNLWEKRRDILVETIRLKNPDLMGTQELFSLQGQYIVEKLPQYTWFGISRRGNTQDEHMGVFYKRDKLTLLDSGNFWLSETPEQPGSMSWNVSLPRMVTWGLFQIVGTSKRFYYYNTHFPHRAEDAAARLECAKVIAARLKVLPPDVPFIMTGDFNAQLGEEVYQVFAGTLRDAFREAPKKSGPETTMSQWTARESGNRIDWILYRGNLKAQEFETVTYNQDGRYPSDHYPVFAVIGLE